MDLTFEEFKLQYEGSDYEYAFNNPESSNVIIFLNINHTDSDSDSSYLIPCSKRPRVAFGDYTATMSANGKPANLVRTIYADKLLLATHSLFFRKMFLEWKKSNQKHITLHIRYSEEYAFMDMVKYAYTLKISRTTPNDLLELLILAEKYEFNHCVECCMGLMLTTTHPLTDEVRHFLVGRFKDISKFEEEMLDLPIAGIEAILSSDDIQVDSEDEIYDFVMKWAGRHCSEPEKRREMLITRLLGLIRFAFMSCLKLMEVLKDSDIRHESELAFGALSSKSGMMHQSHISQDANAMTSVVERAYKLRPVIVMQFHSPREECAVYFDLKREECVSLPTSGEIRSQVFHLGEQVFYLSGHCLVDQQSSSNCFGLLLGMQENGSTGLTVDVEFAARTKPSQEFMSKYKGDYEFVGGKVAGPQNLFGVAWNVFVAEDSPYFINGVLHLRVVLTIKN